MGLTIGDAIAIGAGLATILGLIIIFKPKKDIEKILLYKISNFLGYEFGFNTEPHREGQMVATMKEIQLTVKKIDVFLFGNGNPEESVQYILLDIGKTLTRIDESMNSFHRRQDEMEKKIA